MRKVAARANPSLGQMKKDEDGSIIIFSLFILIVMVMVAGLAVDFMRAETQRVRLQSTLDRAVLAAASLEQALDSETVVRDYFQRAGLDQYLDKVEVTEGAFSKTVSASASAHLKPYFLGFAGINSLPAIAGGTAQEGISDIEVSLILDVSGSMGWNSVKTGHVKIEDLKDAARGIRDERLLRRCRHIDKFVIL